MRDLLDGPGYEDIKKPKSVETINPKDFDAVVYFSAASKIEAVQKLVDAAIGFGGTTQELEDGKAASSVIEVFIHMNILQIGQLLDGFYFARNDAQTLRISVTICVFSR